MKLELVTLSGPKVQEDVFEVILPTPQGSIALYPQHMPLVTTVIPGVIKVRRNRNDSDELVEYFATNGGVVEMTEGVVRMLVDEADRADELVEQDEREALERAQRLKEEAKDEVELEKAQTLIDRQAVRIKVAELRRHRRPRA